MKRSRCLPAICRNALQREAGGGLRAQARPPAKRSEADGRGPAKSGKAGWASNLACRGIKSAPIKIDYVLALSISIR